MKTIIPVTAIWLRGKGENRIEVLAEIEGKWYSVIEERVDTQSGAVIPISHIAEGNGRKHWKCLDLNKAV